MNPDNPNFRTPEEEKRAEELAQAEALIEVLRESLEKARLGLEINREAFEKLRVMDLGDWSVHDADTSNLYVLQALTKLKEWKESK